MCLPKAARVFQEELAEKIGVSRQAVSKWERAEASPDTDNLILLAKIYGVTLDTLLNVAPIPEEPLADTPEVDQEDQPDAEPGTNSSGKLKGWEIFPWPILCGILYLLMGFLDILGGWGIGWLIFLTVPLYYTLGTAIRTRNAEAFAYPVLVTLIYLILGYSKDWWHPGWVLFLTIPVYYLICEAIQKNRK